MRATTWGTRRRSRALAAAGLGAVLLLAGCGGGGGTDGPDGAAPAEVGPLGEYFEQVYGGEESEADWAAEMQEVEELTAACMQEQGFDYTPTDHSSTITEMTPDDGGVEYGTEEYAATEGYGMTTWDEEDMAEDPGEEWVDPNADYVSSMSEGEQAAFYEALYGPSVEVDESDPDAEMAEYDWTTAGCSGEAQHEVQGEDPSSDPAFESLQEEMDRMYTSVQESPEVAELDAAWASCMADAGYPGYTTQQDAMDAISTRSNELYEGVTEESPEPDPAALEEVQQLEIDTAVADFGCKEEVDYDATYQEISLAAEEDFVEAHRAELDAWAEAAGQDP